MAPPQTFRDARSRLSDLPEPIDVANADAAQRAQLAHWLDLLVRFAGRGDAARRALCAPSTPTMRRDAGAHTGAIDALARCGAHVVPFGSALYPPRLAVLPDAPALLFVRGAPGTLCARAVAIVGSRAPTRAALDAAERIAADLARAGVVVVSGLARGIDAAAHRGALAGGGLGIAVFGTGLDVVYPSEHRKLAARIEAQGALVTEFLPGAPPLPYHFPLRNRIVTGIAEVLVVVEARERSGTLVSAAHAMAQGRDVFVAPGPIACPPCAGSNRLLRDGAHVLLESGDVLLRLGIAEPRSPAAAPGDACAPDRPAATPLAGDTHATRILARLGRGGATHDELARALGVDVAQLALPLFELELSGSIGADRNGRLVLRVPGEP